METATTYVETIEKAFPASDFQVHLDLPSLQTFIDRLEAWMDKKSPRQLRSNVFNLTISPQAEWFADNPPELSLYPIKMISWLNNFLRSYGDVRERTVGTLTSRYSVTNSATGKTIASHITLSWTENKTGDFEENCRVIVTRDRRRIEMSSHVLTVYSADKTVDLERWVYSPTGKKSQAWQNEFRREYRPNLTVCPPNRRAASQRLHRAVSEALGLEWDEAYAKYWCKTTVIQESHKQKAKSDQAVMLQDAQAFFSKPYTHAQLIRFVDELQKRENAAGARYIVLPFIKVIDGVEYYLGEEEMSEEEYNSLEKSPLEISRGQGPVGRSDTRESQTRYWKRLYRPLID